MPKIVVSMTSYPQRIVNVEKSISALLNRQTLPPEEIYLWLSVEEFPQKEKNLPNTLVKLIDSNKKIKLNWVDKNTYVHKRHEVFKIVKEAYVFLIDDDVYYDNNLIKTVVGIAQKYPNTIVCYNQYNPHEYKGKRILYNNNRFGNGPLVNKVRWCGQSMIPTSVYPVEILDDAHQKVRNSTSPVSDECWFQPWIVKNDIPIYYCNYGWGTDIDPKTGKKTGIVSWSHQKEANGLERRDNWLYAVLSAYPEIMEKYIKLFNYGKF